MSSCVRKFSNHIRPVSLITTSPLRFCQTVASMFRGGVGRGFVAGYAGLAMIILALLVLIICFCCWFHEMMYRRQRRLSLEEQMNSELTLREDSPKFLKLLANKENARRASNANSISGFNMSDGQPPGFPLIRKCEVMYSGAICPYQAQSSFSMYPLESTVVQS